MGTYILYKETIKMIAEIRKLTDGYIVKFERQFPYTAEEVWSVLTENSKLKNGCPIYRLKALKLLE